jgi:hypothetical protein
VLKGIFSSNLYIFCRLVLGISDLKYEKGL